MAGWCNLRKKYVCMWSKPRQESEWGLRDTGGRIMSNFLFYFDMLVLMLKTWK